MTIKHYLLILLIMALFGSAFVFGKLVLNTNVPPLLFGSLRMLVVVICLLPFFNSSNSYGVILDDIVAGIYTIISLKIIYVYIL